MEDDQTTGPTAFRGFAPGHPKHPRRTWRSPAIWLAVAGLATGLTGFSPFGPKLGADSCPVTAPNGSTPPGESASPEHHGDIGFQASSLRFGSEGCWEVTAAVGVARLVFVTRVIRI